MTCTMYMYLHWPDCWLVTSDKQVKINSLSFILDVFCSVLFSNRNLMISVIECNVGARWSIGNAFD